MNFNQTNSSTEVSVTIAGGIGYVCAVEEGTVAAGAADEDTMSSEVRVG